MNCVLKTLCTVCLAFGVAWGREVTVPAGPLLRVEGQSVALPCSVTNYEGPREQDFDWMVVRGDTDMDTVQIISTFDASFTDVSLRERVASGDILIKRLADNKVELGIKEVKVTDSATYRCKTPSTDTQIVGNYAADVELRVIPNSLVVEPRTPAAVIPEGGTVGLFCNASWDHTLGTQLSVTWSARKGVATLEDLLTFGPDGAVVVTDTAAQRYASGGLRLDLHRKGTYGLVLTGAVPADQGVYVCTVREWTREGGTFYKLQQKRTDIGHVSITPTAQSLNISAHGSTALTTGDTLTLSCLVGADDYSILGLEVAWLTAGSRVLARMDRDGVVSNGSGTDPVAAAGLKRVREGEFRLVVPAMETSDAGMYLCQVRAWARLSGGGWYQAAEKTSNQLQVRVTHLEVSNHVCVKRTAALSGSKTTQQDLRKRDEDSERQKRRRERKRQSSREGEHRFQRALLGPGHARLPVNSPGLECQRDQRPRTNRDNPAAISCRASWSASLGVSGLTRVPGPPRPAWAPGLMPWPSEEPLTFKLRLLQTGEMDLGEYTCSVSTWSPARSGGWDSTVDQQTPAFKLSFATKSPTLSVVARRVREATSSGATFEMSCQVMAENLRSPAYSVLIHAQVTPSAPQRRIASLSPESVVRLEDWSEPGRQDSVVLLRTGPHEFSFRLQGVQVSDRGFYSCEVGAWTKQPGETDWTKAVRGVSNKVQISFDHTGPSFGISISSDTTSVYPWETAKMECAMSVSGTPPNPDDMVFELRWFLTRLRGADDPVLLATMDRHGVVKRGPRNDSSDVSLERSGPHSYRLSLYSAQDSDTGEYHCAATPWIRSPATGSWSQAPALTSARVFLNVKFALWDSMKLPLLFGVCAAAFMGLLSLLLGLICTRCCCRSTSYTPRPRTKLMELEMD
ncbi:prostaglandin F2 receptor negative regulator-like [Alosa alosa]|uniref:prostaglandin F2 receptor negative regulator-like n=1 Tax=Alosa alosa TaxID=278164 RepID=UPI002015346E|nr:prostaglandin F2 receptor negative regulator-like [Alosa alosa]